MGAAGYPVPGQRHRAELSIERSRFVTTVGHAPDPAAARTLIDEVRVEFPDATHHCWAFVAGPPGSTTHIGLSDAGEPHGTAGRPMLDVLLHSGIGEIAAVVTRYFGGVKLGRGGLARAYGAAVQLALAELPTRQRVERITLAITVGYTDIELLKRLLAEAGAEVIEESYGAEVRYVAAVPVPSRGQLERSLVEGTSGRASIMPHP